MSAAEIEALVRTVNWNSAFHDHPPRSDLNFRRKQDDREFLVRFPLGLKAGKFRVGLIRGEGDQQLLVGNAANPDLPPRTDFERGEL